MKIGFTTWHAKTDALPPAPENWAARLRSMGRWLVLAILLAAGGVSLASAAQRTWELTDGTRLDAEMVSATETMVVLRRVDGSRLLLSRERLSPADRAFVTGTSGVADRAGGGSSENRSATTIPAPPSSPSPSLTTPRSPTTAARREPTPAATGSRSAAVAGVVNVARDGHPGLSALNVADTPPTLGFRDPQSGELRNLSQLQGRYTVVTFWAPTIEPSVAEVRKIAGLREATNGLFHHVTVVVGSSTAASQALLNAELTQPATIVGDPQMAIMQRWGATAMPTNVILNEHGAILHEHLYAEQFLELLRARYAR